jgi:hypothetical protein
MPVTMKTRTLKNQHGAVLIFTLVMLLLLTLVSLSMIRQNKVQINLASNAGQQATSFATVETALRATRTQLEVLRYRTDRLDASGDPIPHHCKTAIGNGAATDYPIHPAPHPSSIIALPNNTSSAVVQQVFCISNYQTHSADPNADPSGNEAMCLYDNLGAPILTVNSDHTQLPQLSNVQACTKLNHAGEWVSGSVHNNTACQIEAYVVHVSFTDAITGSQRTVESKFEINCSNDLNP